jgi:cytochrome c
MVARRARSRRSAPQAGCLRDGVRTKGGELMLWKIAVVAVSAGMALISAARAEGDPKQGEAVFKKNCAVCHTTEADKNKIGPSLHGIVGRHSATVGNFQYSEAMKKVDKTWDEQTLETYLANPKEFVPNTKMIFGGLKNEKDRQDLVAFLATQK